MIYPSKRILVSLVVVVFIYVYFTVSSPKRTTKVLKDLIKCNDKNFEFEVDQRGSYWILKNFIKAEHGALRCYESITFTTTTDIRCIDNVIDLAERFV